ncbi:MULTISPECIES: glycerophosphodiester phosphodiesterase [unclassified Variovorax]|uniref:glycerophosphodiester phosphodiesterase n=1 Tax=unclassified Variovorax TaxID=663243 RepID=UPI00076DE1C1|nr:MULTISPECIES: glycerophosphodiester phosphodiesterase [unclassified Variovorax]KWT72497.1 Glycerophosphoryl diester phosphodiesterase [Variovorax sp. WDL1]PNG47465.1 Glycerophosphoryl diester phosphodiesterase [Variovorax sp. B2]PNG47884.1 Glycerophosphoryl diester phosphodiesterase [Variovorax sp. B4]VTV15379.1 Glycerophosphoryl diester phosphodiesterase [Variovorax sp. WDL1]
MNRFSCVPWLLTASLLGACSALPPSPRQAFDLQAHRGGRALAPENTLAAFDNALDMGVSTLELDIGLTADGVVVVSHDTVLNPDHTRDANGAFLAAKGPAIRTLRFSQLQAYDVGRIDPATPYGKQFALQVPRDGERIPSLAALFDRMRARNATQVRFNIETKLDPARPDETAAPDEMVRALLAEIDKAGMGSRVTVQSFDWRTLALVGQWAPHLQRAYLTSGRTLRDPRWTSGLRLEDFGSAPRLVKAAVGNSPGKVIWSPAFNDLTAAQVREGQALGFQVVPWTVNQRADMARLMDWRVDGIITDDPALLRDLMRERGLALPPSSRP